MLFYSDFCTKLFCVYLYSFCKEDKSNLKNLDYFLRNLKFENDRYAVVDKLDEPEIQTKKKSKKTIVENDIGDNEPIVENK